MDNINGSSTSPALFRTFNDSQSSTDNTNLSTDEQVLLKFIVRHNSWNNNLIFIPASIAAVAVAMLLLVLLIWCRKRRVQKNLFKLLQDTTASLECEKLIPINHQMPINDQADILPYNREYEIDREAFTIGQSIGSGTSCRIFQGMFKTSENGPRRVVAVKTPLDPTNIQQYRTMVKELKIMAFIRPHENVLSLVGACTSGIQRRKLFVLVSFCDLGSLLDHLQNQWVDISSNQETALHLLLGYAYQIANGLEHLHFERASVMDGRIDKKLHLFFYSFLHAKKSKTRRREISALLQVVHGDIALRNVLLTGRHIVKVADFGMSHWSNTDNHMDASPNTLFPLRWMSPEAISTAAFTQKSDVWALGVLLWELFSNRVPYFELEHQTFNTFAHWLRRGNRLLKPEMASDDIYAIMGLCWMNEPELRPTFSQCKRRIGQHFEEVAPARFVSTSLALSDEWLQIALEMRGNKKLRQELLDEIQLQDVAIGVEMPYANDNEAECYVSISA